jgi:hypothetical protein
MKYMRCMIDETHCDDMPFDLIRDPDESRKFFWTDQKFRELSATVKRWTTDSVATSLRS